MAEAPVLRMSPAQSRRIVLLTIVGSGLVVIIERASTGKWPEPRLFFALAIIYIVLGFGSDLAPQIAGPFALLVFLTLLIARGGGVFTTLSHLVQTKPTQPPAKRQLGKERHG